MSSVSEHSWTWRVGFWTAVGAAFLSLTAASALAAARATVFEAGSETSLSFARRTARLVGPEALVLVECAGPKDGICSGTVTVSAGGHQHKTPFSLLGGSRQSLAVTVGPAKALSGTSGLAVARTLQAGGGFARSSEVLHFR